MFWTTGDKTRTMSTSVKTYSVRLGQSQCLLRQTSASPWPSQQQRCGQSRTFLMSQHNCFKAINPWDPAWQTDRRRILSPTLLLSIFTVTTRQNSKKNKTKRNMKNKGEKTVLVQTSWQQNQGLSEEKKPIPALSLWLWGLTKSWLNKRVSSVGYIWLTFSNFLTTFKCFYSFMYFFNCWKRTLDWQSRHNLQ